MQIFNDIPLSGYTTLGLGGPAKALVIASTVADLTTALKDAAQQGLPVLILGGGSNIVVPDAGFDGLVVKMGIKGRQMQFEGGDVLVHCGAGEDWDAFVRFVVGQGLQGIECLSGIPGSVGATPIQNVGAYGQEVGERIVTVAAIDRQSLEPVTISHDECGFGYRTSRFKTVDAGTYVITGVTFRLSMGGSPVLHYEELRKFIAETTRMNSIPPGRGSLETIREAVIALRKKKSMVLDPADPNTKSVGSFFTNPVVSPEKFAAIGSAWKGEGAVPSFPAEGGVKIPAAWLIEQAGFPKGYRMGGVGISTNHSLALINAGGTTEELLKLAETIRARVRGKFGVDLEREPVVVGQA